MNGYNRTSVEASDVAWKGHKNRVITINQGVSVRNSNRLEMARIEIDEDYRGGGDDIHDT